MPRFADGTGARSSPLSWTSPLACSALSSTSRSRLRLASPISRSSGLPSVASLCAPSRYVSYRRRPRGVGGEDFARLVIEHDLVEYLARAAQAIADAGGSDR